MLQEEDADSLPGAFLRPAPPRPSEQWEMVMEDIEEVDEPTGTLSSMNTLRTKGTAGEFGTNTSKSKRVDASNYSSWTKLT